MSVLERSKKRGLYKKSEDVPLLPLETNIYQPSPIESSPPFDSSAQVDGATPVPQLSFTDDRTSSISGDGLATSVPSGASTALVAQAIPNDQVALPVRTDAKPLRVPTRIRGTGKKSSGTMLAPKVSGKRTVTHVVVLALVFLVVSVALAAVLPLTSDGSALGGSGSLFGSLMRWSQGKNGGNSVLIASQIATATAVTQDGYDNGNQTYAGVPTSNGSASASDAGNLNRFFYGQCTYWANMRYHQVSGHWVPWLGNAAQWAYQAAAYGWVVSPTPHLPSIMVLQPYVQGAGYYGHVAVVESINGNDVTTSNWNAAGGGWGITSYIVNHPGPGVSFVWFPGA